MSLAGEGAIGKSLALKLAAGGVPGVGLTAVSARDHAKAQAFVDSLAHPVKLLRIEQLEPEADLVIECAPAALLEQIVGPFLRKRKKAIVLSVGAILHRPELIELARESGGAILVPTGALIGLDAMLAAALALAGVGPERTTIELYADPGVTRNTHSITVDSDSARFTMTIESIPSENPKTGRIVAQSVIALLRKATGCLRVGT